MYEFVNDCEWIKDVFCVWKWIWVGFWTNNEEVYSLESMDCQIVNFDYITYGASNWTRWPQEMDHG